MLLTIEAIQQALVEGRIAEHRNINVELKESWAEGHGTKLSALANKQGIERLWLLVGIADDGRCVGRDEKWARQTEQVVSQHLNQKLDPVQACVAIRCATLGSNWFVAVELCQPGAVVKWGGKAYKAAGTTQAEMTPQETLELTIRLPGLSDYTKQAWQGEVDADLVSDFSKTLAAARPADLSDLPGLDKNAALDRIRIGRTQAARVLFAPVPYRLVALDGAGAVVLNETKTGVWKLLGEGAAAELQAVVDKVSPQTTPYSVVALREALANMVAHAAYFERDGELVVEITPDAVSLSNLCLPESGAFANKWFSRSHKSANAFLMEVLRLAGRVDELGRGKGLIIRESIVRGRQPPRVFIEPAGRFSRWKLVIPGGKDDPRTARLLERLRAVFQNERNALIALALMHWRSEPVSKIRSYIDEESAGAFADVLAEPRGPLWFDAKADRLHLNRWAEVLLGEGKDSKRLSEAEEDRIYQFAYRIHVQFHQGVMTSEQFREHASFGDTPAEKTLCSTTLSRWVKKGWLQRVGTKGRFQFVRNPELDKAEADKARSDFMAKIFGPLFRNQASETASSPATPTSSAPKTPPGG